MAVKGRKYVADIYNEKLKAPIRNLIDIIGGPSRHIDVKVYYKGPSSTITCTRLSGKKKDRLLICIGCENVREFAGVPEIINNKQILIDTYSNITIVIYGLMYHELGHDLFTDLKCTDIVNYKEPKYIPFIHNMFNIIEDPIVEFSIEEYYRKEYPYSVNPKEYFDFLIKNVFMVQAQEYEDDKTQQGFLNYLLLFLRCGEENIKNSCAIFKKYEPNLIPLIRDIVYEPDGTQRIKKTIILCEWIIENIKEFNWEMDQPDEILSGIGAGGSIASPQPGAGGGGFGAAPCGGALEEGPTSGDPQGTARTGEEMPEPEEPEESEEDNESEEFEEDDESETGETEEAEKDEEPEDDEEEENPLPPSTPTFIPPEPDEDFINECFEDCERTGDDHSWFIAKEECEPSSVAIEEVNKVISDNIELINDVSDFFITFKGRIKPVKTEGMTSGRLSIRRAISSEIRGGCDQKIFKRKMARGRDADACVSELIDVSGSMNGKKSIIAFEASVVVAQACEWAGIPFEMNAFVNGYREGYCENVTIVEKSFEDSFEDSKGFFALSNSSLKGEVSGCSKVPLFSGNEEEVNIYYIWKNLKKVKHRTKLMFVICDGMTCGSRTVLRDTVAAMEDEDNIIVIGIGIMCSEVKDSYRHYKVFNSIEEIQNELAPYLIDTITQYAM